MILVVGATGLLGGRIVRRLLSDGRTVRILVRAGSNHQSLVDAGAVAVIGDLKDPPSLTSACDSAEAIVTTANAAFRGGEDTFETVDDAGNENLIRAAAAAGVGRFVFTSVLGCARTIPRRSCAPRASRRLGYERVGWCSPSSSRTCTWTS